MHLSKRLPHLLARELTGRGTYDRPTQQKDRRPNGGQALDGADRKGAQGRDQGAEDGHGGSFPMGGVVGGGILFSIL